MHSSDVRKRIDAYEHIHRAQEQGRRELDRFGLITRDDDLDTGDSGLDGEWNRERTPWAKSRLFETAIRLVLLVGTVMIATLAIFFG